MIALASFAVSSSRRRQCHLANRSAGANSPLRRTLITQSVQCYPEAFDQALLTVGLAKKPHGAPCYRLRPCALRKVRRNENDGHALAVIDQQLLQVSPGMAISVIKHDV
jgi:hypothetical protein